MTDIQFIEEKRTYRGHGCLFTEPGVYTVEEHVAQRLLAGIPQWFRLVQPASVEVQTDSPVSDEAAADTEEIETSTAANAPQAPESTPDNAKPAINLSKANRAQLEAVATDIGLEVTDEMNTNKSLKEAIEEHQKETATSAD